MRAAFFQSACKEMEQREQKCSWIKMGIIDKIYLYFGRYLEKTTNKYIGKSETLAQEAGFLNPAALAKYPCRHKVNCRWQQAKAAWAADARSVVRGNKF